MTLLTGSQLHAPVACRDYALVISVLLSAPQKLWGYAQSLGKSIPFPRLENWSALRSFCHKLSPEVYTCTVHIACEHAKVEASHSLTLCMQD